MNVDQWTMLFRILIKVIYRFTNLLRSRSSLQGLDNRNLFMEVGVGGYGERHFYTHGCWCDLRIGPLAHLRRAMIISMLCNVIFFTGCCCVHPKYAQTGCKLL